MDRERLGRVLGRGARLAARTAYEAVDAATAESPRQARPTTPQAAEPQIIPPQTSARSTPPAPRPAPNYANAAAVASRSVAAPLKKASKQLWHELSGCFFALFAFSFAGAVWKTRANAVSAVPDTRYRFYGFCALALLFLYFSVSSFLRARRVR